MHREHQAKNHRSWGIRSVIPLEDKVLAGLDEFMLRLGHLKVICGIASQGAGSLLRLKKEVSQALTRFVTVPPDIEQAVANYLLNKELCSSVTTGQPVLQEERG